LQIERRRGRRRRITEAKIKTRLRFLHSMGRDDWYYQMFNEPHRLAKRNPWDCGRSRCWSCHSEKLGKEKRRFDIKEHERYESIMRP